MAKIKWIFWACVFPLLMGCMKEESDCFKSAKNPKEEIRTLPSFTTLQLETFADVYLSEAAEQNIRVVYSEKLLNQIDLSVESNTLFIRSNEDCRFVRNLKNKPSIYIESPNVENIEYRGNGFIYSQNTLTQLKNIDVWLGGRSIELNCELPSLNVRLHAGTCDIQLSGKCDSLYVFQRGNGFINLQNLESKEAFLDHKGTGDTRLWVKDDLNFQLLFSGNLYLKGEPKIGKQEISNRGRLIRVR
jgi:hypothetical protein